MKRTPDTDSQRPTSAKSTCLVKKRSTATLFSTTLTGILLLTASSLPLVRADTSAPVASSGTYRSSEGSTQTDTELGEALSITPLPDPANALSTRQASASQAATQYSNDWTLLDTWITDIGLLLYNDADHDGYFTGFSLSADADTLNNNTDVYLSIEIQRSLYPVESLHTSEVFPLYGQTFADEYQIDIELVRSYPTDEYDLIIELRDAYDHSTLDRITSADFANLRDLPLESEDFDTSYYAPVYEPLAPDTYNDDIRVDESAGSLGWLPALAMTLLLLIRRGSATARGLAGSAAANRA